MCVSETVLVIAFRSSMSMTDEDDSCSECCPMRREEEIISFFFVPCLSIYFDDHLIDLGMKLKERIQGSVQRLIASFCSIIEGLGEVRC